MQDLKNWKGCPAPKGVALEGRFVKLEAYERDRHLQDLWDGLGGMAINPLLKYFTQPDFRDIDAFDAWLTAAQEKSGWVTEVFRDKATGIVVGMANYMRADPANGVVEVGSVAHGAAMARSPLSTEVHYLMAKHAFEDLGYRRYEWKCHSENMASRKTAARLGFTFEGIFRQHMISKGGNRDTAWFSMIDSEWPLLNAAFETWLAADNFDEDGRQKRRLEDIRSDLERQASK
ncbi:GNAT family N-acetyltransferase [Ensifer sp. ENS07]|uniref:GNAT family N-acetyltransferase n=1 Tax=Ensifer adhaerens TaxID=106592 RepID=A0A9Q8Y5C4_ENSAD|nr:MULTISPECIES: GNAT family protein [Ensifer]OWZ91543.1 N-acetyltransferase [Sinorhizobium sp. LM21]KQX57702.1 acetyltransferase [Ensifer sp. Root1298]KQX92865.1 acetyltransferase [Ensifer sp. Root1312]KRC28633.1 acetyltransferase [Ensifer sp. Root74]KRD78661.1 acetyltransferase [Ensifer sp. Root954]